MYAALGYAAERYAAGRLVDIGCGTKPFKGIFAPYVNEHVGVDHEQTMHGLESVDVISGAYDIPLDDESADTVLLTEVLEHLERPGEALAECRRLLRPGGHLILTTPLSWPVRYLDDDRLACLLWPAALPSTRRAARRRDEHPAAADGVPLGAVRPPAAAQLESPARGPAAVARAPQRTRKIGSTMPSGFSSRWRWIAWGGS
jgi:SAM-dependent methyltransferase